MLHPIRKHQTFEPVCRFPAISLFEQYKRLQRVNKSLSRSPMIKSDGEKIFHINTYLYHTSPIPSYQARFTNHEAIEHQSTRSPIIKSDGKKNLCIHTCLYHTLPISSYRVPINSIHSGTH